MARILIVEDEPDMRRGLQDNLEFEGYETLGTANGKEGLRLAQKEPFDFILLDLMLPGMDGVELCRRLKEEGSKIPIIMLTARGAEDDKVEGFEAGADDYLTKPFSLRELLARVKAILRRTHHEPEPIQQYAFADITINFNEYQAAKGGRSLDLSPREFEMMRLLIENKNDVVTRDQFLEQVWGYSTMPATRTVDNHIAKLRQKIEDDPENPRHIITLHRMGYKFIP